MSTQWRHTPDGRWQYLASDGNWYDNPAPAPPHPAYAYRAPSTNGMAIASLVLGIVWLWGLGSILALVFGYVSLRQIRERNESGKGMAIAGVVLGWVGIVGLVLFIVLIIVVAHNAPHVVCGANGICNQQP